MIKVAQKQSKWCIHGQALALGSLGSGWHSAIKAAQKAIKVAHIQTSTCFRVLRVRAVQHNQSGANTIKAGSLGLGEGLGLGKLCMAFP